jgi:hypothetical protein
MYKIRLWKRRKRKRRFKNTQSAAIHLGIAALFISTRYYSNINNLALFYGLQLKISDSASVLRRVRFFYVTYWKYMTCESGRSPPFD